MPLSRRQTLKSFASGFGTLALANLFAAESHAANSSFTIQNSALPHFPAKAKRVIFLFMSGGPSHVDLFDPKPLLTRDHGKPLPFEMPKLVRTKTGNLLSSPWKFKKHGQSGTEVSELLPHTASVVDDLCVVR